MNEHIPYMPPEIAVADAMHFVRRFSERRGKKLLDSPYLSSISVEKQLEVVSRGECRTGSIIALNYLQKHFGDEFDTLMLVKGSIPTGNAAEHLWAIYFLAHSKSSDKWFSGSPANHRANQAETPFTRIPASKDLGEVFAEIAEIEGGIWPQASAVLASLVEYQDPEFSISNIGNHESRIFTYDADPGIDILPNGTVIPYPTFEMAEYSLHPSYQVNIAA